MENWIVFLFCLLLIALLIVGCDRDFGECDNELKTCLDGSKVGKTGALCEFEKCPEDKGIKDSERACQVDADCKIVMTECSCDCGIAINKNYVETYRNALEQKCEDYEGPLCKMLCENVAKCVDNLCTSVELES